MATITWTHVDLSSVKSYAIHLEGSFNGNNLTLEQTVEMCYTITDSTFQRNNVTLDTNNGNVLQNYTFNMATKTPREQWANCTEYFNHTTKFIEVDKSNDYDDYDFRFQEQPISAK